MSGEGSQSEEAGGEAIDLPKLWRSVKRRKSWIIVPTGLAFAASLATVVLVHPRYTGVAKVLLENQESYFTRPEKAGQELAPALDPEAVQSQAETIASTTLARKAIAKLDLADRPEFYQYAAPSPLEAALSLLGLARQASVRTTEDRLVEAFLNHLTAFPVAKTRVLQIEFVSRDPEFAARGANVVAELFLDQQEEAKKNAAKAAGAWLAAKISELRAKVADVDAKVEAFRAQSGLLATGKDLTAPSQQLADINTQLAAARSAQAAAQAKAQMLHNLARQGRLADDPDLARDDTLRRLAEQRIALKAQIAQESRTLLPEHPRMKELAGQLAELEAQIRLAAEKAARALENEARVAGDQVETMSETLAAQAKTVAAGNQEDVQLRALQLDANAARDQLESYVQKYREAIARDADNAAPADARVIALANEPRNPTFPKKIETLLLGTLAGFLLSAGVAVSRALLDDDQGAPVGRRPNAAARIEPTDSPRPEAAPLAPQRPTAELAKPEGALGEGAARLAGIDELVDRLTTRATAGGARFALIAGAGEGAGRAAALELGRALAAKGRAVLIDLGPTPADWLSRVLRADGAEASRLIGLIDALDGLATFEDALHRDLSSPLDIIPSGSETWPIEEGFDEVLVALAETHDFVIAHAPDWRDPGAEICAELIGEMVLVAPAKDLPAELDAARAQMAASLALVGLTALNRGAPLERAA
ncbi:MAG TPA: exopolysaccharide transport family protein [Roseiarcus sp.]|nr:exopolysaccharide transport family protein [Roseiarcus sp.]